MIGLATEEFSESEGDDEILKDFDEEEMKEINEMQGIEGLLDEELQNEFGFIEPEFDQHDDDKEVNPEENQQEFEQQESNININLPKSKKTSKKKRSQSKSRTKNNDENEEWILDHTGVRRKPFKIMHREIKDIQMFLLI